MFEIYNYESITLRVKHQEGVLSPIQLARPLTKVFMAHTLHCFMIYDHIYVHTLKLHTYIQIMVCLFFFILAAYRCNIL